MTHSATLLILNAFAVFRLTKLVNSDTITAGVRERLIGSRPGESRDLGGMRIIVAARPRLAEFITCPWCVSFWAAIVVVALQALVPGLWIFAAAVLAFSAVAGLLSAVS